MVRDMDLIREILLRAEKDENSFAIEGRTKNDLFEHVLLAKDEGLIEVNFRVDNSFDITRLTWKGHDFLDNIRNDTVWAKVKRKIAEKGGGGSFEVIVALAQEYAKQALLSS